MNKVGIIATELRQNTCRVQPTNLYIYVQREFRFFSYRTMYWRTVSSWTQLWRPYTLPGHLYVPSKLLLKASTKSTHSWTEFGETPFNHVRQSNEAKGDITELVLHVASGHIHSRDVVIEPMVQVCLVEGFF